jgi:hypothetical protein
MICQLDLFCGGSIESSLGHMPSSFTWLSVLAKWTTGELQQPSSNIVSTIKNTRKSMQKSTGSSWMPLLLSKIIPCVSKGLRCRGPLKVSLTLKGWVSSLPMPSGAHVSQMTKMMKNALDSITKDIDSEEEVMKWPSGLVMGVMVHYSWIASMV